MQYYLQADFATLARIEQELGCSLMALARKLVEGSLGLEHISRIIFYCHAPQQMSRAELEAQLLQGGLLAATKAVSDLFIGIFSGVAEDKIARQDLQELMQQFPDAPEITGGNF